MDLIDKINEIAARIKNTREHISTEEATKNAVIMPFINALGYDIFNPMEVIPEFTADVGLKKGEKVDYAIKKDGKIILLIECKWINADLKKVHINQLYRYFHTTEARFGILTNGVEYIFYSDIKEKNKMDEKPFFTFNLTNFEEHHVAELKKFTKTAFSLDDILNTASTLKYSRAIKKILDDELESPSEGFVKFLASQVYNGVMTKKTVAQFNVIVKEARDQFINDKINQRLKLASSLKRENNQGESTTEEGIDPPDNGIVTTQDEMEGYQIVKAICAEVLDPDRVIMKDTKSYCGILLDNNNRRPICRLHFNASQKYLGLISNKEEERIPISNLSEIYKFADRIKTAALSY